MMGVQRRERYSLFYLFFFIGLSLLLPLSFFLIYKIISLKVSGKKRAKKKKKKKKKKKRGIVEKRKKKRRIVFFFLCGNRRQLYTN